MKKYLYYSLIVCAILLFSADSMAKLSRETREKKEIGWYPAPLPLVNFSSDDGAGGGLRVYLYNNGNPEDIDYDEIPYFTRIYAQFFTTTNGYSYHELNLDKFNVFGTKYRIKSLLLYDRRINANFYGIGGDAARKGLTDIDGNHYSTYDDYEDFLKSDNYQNYKYNKYEYIKPIYRFYFFGDITEDFIFLTGIEAKKVKINSWEGRRFEDPSGDSHTSGETLLDLSRNSIIGYNGGWTNFVKFGAACDTRDFEPDPSRGIYADYSFVYADNRLGSEYEFHRSTAGVRSYITLFKPLVLALRAAYTDTSGGTPFYELTNFEFLFDNQEGLGGLRTLRGYPLSRFIGETMTMGNAELRLRLFEVLPFSQRFEFKLIAFYDTGNVYDRAFDPFKKPGFGDYKYSCGGGLVIAWNQATIIHAYFGFSPETSAISVNFENSI